MGTDIVIEHVLISGDRRRYIDRTSHISGIKVKCVYYSVLARPDKRIRIAVYDRG